jgi:hypothetical protein
MEKMMRKTLRKIQGLFPHSEKLLLHVPIGALVALGTLLYSDDPWEMMRNATDIGVMKEVWDYGRNKYITMENVWDLLATMLGGALVSVWFF